MKMKIKGFLILLIAWIVIIPLYTWMGNLPNSMDYFLLASSLLFLLISVTVVYPLILVWKYYRKKIKNNSQDGLSHIKKIDKISLSLALIIAIILTLLLLSTYESTENGVTQKGIGWYMIEGLSNPYNGVLVSLYIISILFFCFELIASYFVISILLLWKKSKK
jgi:heme/copper-type cytochrome/quinol oxidase subunit 2